MESLYDYHITAGDLGQDMYNLYVVEKYFIDSRGVFLVPQTLDNVPIHQYHDFLLEVIFSSRSKIIWMTKPASWKSVWTKSGQQMSTSIGKRTPQFNLSILPCQRSPHKQQRQWMGVTEALSPLHQWNRERRKPVIGGRFSLACCLLPLSWIPMVRWLATHPPS